MGKVYIIKVLATWFLESKNIQDTAGIIELGGGRGGMPLPTLFSQLWT